MLFWYKGVFLGTFFSLNKPLLCFFVFFLRGGYFFTWQLQNAAETSVMQVKWSWNFGASESLEMQATPAQCGWVHIPAFYSQFFQFYIQKIFFATELFAEILLQTYHCFCYLPCFLLTHCIVLINLIMFMVIVKPH